MLAPSLVRTRNVPSIAATTPMAAISRGRDVEVVVEALGSRLPDGRCADGSEGEGRDDRADIRLEQVRAHSRDITDVVTDVVGDGRRVAGVVFGYALFDLAHQVCADVGGLGVDAPTDPGEERDGGCAEAEPRHDGGLLEYPVEEGYAYQTYAHHRHAHHRAAVERHPQRWVESHHRLDGRPGIGPDRDAHADESRQAEATAPAR